MTNCVTYKRFSTKAQDKGSSLDRQTTAINAMVEQHKWTVIEELEDLGASAWRGDHLKSGALGRFKERVDAGEVDPGTILVIENIDRLSRQNVKKARRWVEEVTEAGIGVAVASKNKVFNEASLSGENIIDLLEYLMEAKRSNEESQIKSARNTGAWRKAEKDAAETGKLITRTVPAWIEVTPDGKRVEIPERGDIVRRIYELCASGIGYMSISKLLNEEGVEPWGKAGVNKHGLWEWSYVRNILKHPAVEGEYHAGRKIGRPTGQVIENYYPVVVPPDLVARARTAMSNRSRTGGANYANPANLFAGLIKCGACNGNMLRRPSRSLTHERAGRQASYLQCYEAKRGGSCQHKKFYRYEHFEKAALDQVLNLALKDQYFKRSDQTAALANQLAQAKKKLEHKKAAQARLLGLIMEDDDADEAKAMLKVVRGEVRESEDRVKECEDALAKARGSVSPEEHAKRVVAMAHAINSEDEKTRSEARVIVREALGAVIDRVVCKPTDDLGNEGRRFTLWAADNHLMIEFDNEGNITSDWDLVGLTNDNDPIFKQMSDEIMQGSRHSGKALEAVKRIAPPKRFAENA
jgi:DNA invertase Pin-like site-specific DNA recombinase/transcription elongation GreA/GreB family factor